MLLLDLLITKAREICKQRLTLLLVEALAINLDAGNFGKLLEALSREDFQTVVSLPPNFEQKILIAENGKSTLNMLECTRN